MLAVVSAQTNLFPFKTGIAISGKLQAKTCKVGFLGDNNNCGKCGTTCKVKKTSNSKACFFSICEVYALEAINESLLL